MTVDFRIRNVFLLEKEIKATCSDLEKSQGYAGNDKRQKNFFFCLFIIHMELNAGYFARTQTTRANRNRLMRTVFVDSDLFYIRLPSAIGFPIRVRNAQAESKRFAADFTFSHGFYTSQNPSYNLQHKTL